MVSAKKLRSMEGKIDEFRMRIKDSGDRAVFADVFDTATLMALYELAKKGYIDAMGGSVSTGKEANIFHAVGLSHLSCHVSGGGIGLSQGDPGL